MTSSKGRGPTSGISTSAAGWALPIPTKNRHCRTNLAEALSPLVKGLDLTLVMEPGRVIVGNAGILVTKALYEKIGESKRFVIVDAAMNDLIRPSLYSAYHDIRPVSEALLHRPKHSVDVVGPVCESGDFLAKDRSITGGQTG